MLSKFIPECHFGSGFIALAKFNNGRSSECPATTAFQLILYCWHTGMSTVVNLKNITVVS